MIAEHLRDAAMTAVVFGFFSTVWFGWAQEAPPKGWRRYLIGATAVAFLAAAGGLATAITHWSDGTSLGPAAGRTFGIIVGVEFAAAGIGAGVLAATGRARWIAPWVAFVVGVHLIPVAGVFAFPAIAIVGGLITVVSIVAVPVARARALPPSAVTGAPTGVVLTSGALYSLVTALVAY